MTEDSEKQSSSHDSEQALRELLARLISIGYGCLLLSAILLAVSILTTNSETQGSEVTLVIWLTLARVVGIGSFIIGLIAIFNRFWTHGTLLLVGSIALPTFSLIFHGTV